MLIILVSAICIRLASRRYVDGILQQISSLYTVDSEHIGLKRKLLMPHIVSNLSSAAALVVENTGTAIGGGVQLIHLKSSQGTCSIAASSDNLSISYSSTDGVSGSELTLMSTGEATLNGNRLATEDDLRVCTSNSTIREIINNNENMYISGVLSQATGEGAQAVIPTELRVEHMIAAHQYINATEFSMQTSIIADNMSSLEKMIPETFFTNTSATTISLKDSGLTLVVDNMRTAKNERYVNSSQLADIEHMYNNLTDPAGTPYLKTSSDLIVSITNRLTALETTAAATIEQQRKRILELESSQGASFFTPEYNYCNNVKVYYTVEKDESGNYILVLKLENSTYQSIINYMKATNAESFELTGSITIKIKSEHTKLFDKRIMKVTLVILYKKIDELIYKESSKMEIDIINSNIKNGNRYYYNMDSFKYYGNDENMLLYYNSFQMPLDKIFDLYNNDGNVETGNKFAAYINRHVVNYLYAEDINEFNHENLVLYPSCFEKCIGSFDPSKTNLNILHNTSPKMMQCFDNCTYDAFVSSLEVDDVNIMINDNNYNNYNLCIEEENSADNCNKNNDALDKYICKYNYYCNQKAEICRRSNSFSYDTIKVPFSINVDKEYNLIKILPKYAVSADNSYATLFSLSFKTPNYIGDQQDEEMLQFHIRRNSNSKAGYYIEFDMKIGSGTMCGDYEFYIYNEKSGKKIYLLPSLDLINDERITYNTFDEIQTCQENVGKNVNVEKIIYYDVEYIDESNIVVITFSNKDMLDLSEFCNAAQQESSDSSNTTCRIFDILTFDKSEINKVKSNYLNKVDN